MNILYINNKKAQESRCWTEKLGVNQCMIAAKNAVLDKFGVKIEESTVEQILRFGTADISAPYLDCISSIARQYVAELFSTLCKYEYNPGTTLERCGRNRKDQRQPTGKRICCRTPR